MVSSKLGRVLALVDREFRGQPRAPVRQKFKAHKINLSSLDDWERQRS